MICVSAVTKETVIRILEEIAVLLELSGENPFKSRAYRNAARNLENLDVNLINLVCENNLSSVPGIGEAINKKIKELVSTGKLAYYEALKSAIPSGHLEMLKIPGLGPKKINVLYKQLGIKTIGELEYACHENRLVEIAGFGEKTQNNILAGIEKLKIFKERRLYAEAASDAILLLSAIRNYQDIGRVSLAGSLRRSLETIKDIDIVASAENAEKLADYFAGLPEVDKTLARGNTKVSVTLRTGINADLRIVSDQEFPHALLHFTGSKEHNTALRSRAKARGLKINEYGLWRGDENIFCRSEEEIFSHLGLSYIPPELRENMGEMEAAEKKELPSLVEENDICGLFHIHTGFSDGAETLEAMVQAAIKMGMQYIGVSDHSQSAYYAGGLKKEEIAEQHRLVDELNKKYAPFYIFKGIESDILPDGNLDYTDDVLKSFDFVIAAIHSGFNMSSREMTGRIKKALQNPYTLILAHPTGRLLLARDPYQVNIREIIDEASKYGKALELNANPHRLDLDWRNCIYAREKRVKIFINPDAHNITGLYDIRFGVKIARKGWLTKEDCPNCFSLDAMKKYLACRNYN
ncbi:MAG: DNA polymerase/3'-5' exonuclease PolX [Smithella sp. PtaU1.Bin162]|nr:MAG: DNA polymerase/3'-5' exonuclease PolX [Smithella sp. PtaU1.Bin162]